MDFVLRDCRIMVARLSLTFLYGVVTGFLWHSCMVWLQGFFDIHVWCGHRVSLTFLYGVVTGFLWHSCMHDCIISVVFLYVVWLQGFFDIPVCCVVAGFLWHSFMLCGCRVSLTFLYAWLYHFCGIPVCYVVAGFLWHSCMHDCIIYVAFLHVVWLQGFVETCLCFCDCKVACVVAGFFLNWVLWFHGFSDIV